MVSRDRAVPLVVGVGGAAGAVTRWAVGQAAPWHPPDWPIATLVVNLVGCVLIGLLLTVWLEGPSPPWWARPFAAVGFVGGFTTFSAFAVEAVLLLDAGAPGTALGYVLVSVVVGVLLVRASGLLARRLLARRGGRW